MPAPLNYGSPPFPKSICTSLNHVVCHGIPSSSKTLKNGDNLNIDITVITKDGYFGDTSKMFFAGQPSVLSKGFQTSREMPLQGIEKATAGNKLGDIGHAIQDHAERNKFSVVREFCGHGILKVFRRAPSFTLWQSQRGNDIEKGMCFTVEPMINAGKRHIKILPDQWTAVTKDHKLSAQWEHTIMVTEVSLKSSLYERTRQAPANEDNQRGRGTRREAQKRNLTD